MAVWGPLYYGPQTSYLACVPGRENPVSPDWCVNITVRVPIKKQVPSNGWLWMSMFKLADLWGICSYQACLHGAPVLDSLHWAGSNELLWLSSFSSPTAVCIHSCLSLSRLHTTKRLYLFQTTFSGGQMSKPGQAGECKPSGCQWGSSQHQHCNQLQHTPDRVRKPARETRHKIRTVNTDGSSFSLFFCFGSQHIQNIWEMLYLVEVPEEP